MSAITTEDCKKYLVQSYIEKGAITQEKDWKRTKKYKNDDGLWIRDFNHPGIGDVSLLENKDNSLSLVATSISKEKSIKEKKVTASKIFDLTVFSSEQISQAWKTYKNYYRCLDRDDDADEFVKKNKSSIRFIPSILNWYVDADAYENGKLLSDETTWNSNLKGFYIRMFDQKDSNEYGGDEHLLEKYFPKYLESVNDNCYEITTDITAEQLVIDLSHFGYNHVNSYNHMNCVLKKLFKDVHFNKNFFVVPQLEEDILNGDISGYSISELNNQKINGENVAIFALNNEKYDIFNYLVKNKIEITNEELDKFISQDYMSLYDDKVKRLCFANYILHNNKDYSNDVINKLAFILQQSKDENLVVKLFYKYGNVENSLYFAQLGNLMKNEEVMNLVIPRLSKHDDLLKTWLDFTLIHNKDLSIIERKEVRDALPKEYMREFLSDIHAKYVEGLQKEAKKTQDDFMLMRMYGHDAEDSWLYKRTRSVAEFVEIKNKILSYYEQFEEVNKPKYRTKF